MLPSVLALAFALLLPQATNDPKTASRLSAGADMDRVQGRLDTALAGYRQALAIDPAYLPARHGLGLVLDLTGHHDDARAEYLAALEGRRQSYDGAMFLRSLATSYVFDRRFDDARGALQEWEQLVVTRFGVDPNNAVAFFDLAMAADAFDEAERALAAHYGPIAKPPVLPPSTVPDSHLLMPRLDWMRYNAQRAVIAARRGQRAAAERFMTEADLEARALGDVLANFAKATGRAVSLNPAGELVLPKAEMTFWLGDSAGALRLLAGQQIMSPRHHLLLGEACEREHRLAAARAAYARIVASTEFSIELAWAQPIAQERLAAMSK